MKILPLFAAICTSLLLSSCDDQKEDFVPAATVAEYMPATVGKYIIYRLDSTVFTSQGAVIETHKYQVKHTVTASSKDANNNTTLTIQRQIRNEAGTTAWSNQGLIYATIFDNKLETVENNLRIVNLAAPVMVGTKWLGNNYLPQSPYRTLFPEISIANDLNKWEYQYTNKSDTTIAGTSYSNVLSIQQNNDVLNFPITTGTQIASKLVGYEKYAPGVGLIYKDLQIREYQGGHSGNAYTPQHSGFGILMWAIEHN